MLKIDPCPARICAGGKRPTVRAMLARLATDVHHDRRRRGSGLANEVSPASSFLPHGKLSPLGTHLVDVTRLYSQAPDVRADLIRKTSEACVGNRRRHAGRRRSSERCVGHEGMQISKAINLAANETSPRKSFSSKSVAVCLAQILVFASSVSRTSIQASCSTAMSYGFKQD